VIPEKVVMESSLFKKLGAMRRAEGVAEGVAKGLAKGEARGRAEEARFACASLAKELHPSVAPRVVPVIQACSDLTRLRRWTLRAASLNDVEFARLVTGRGGGRSTRRRAPRPARKAARAASR
jgi:hypothetical protein